MHLLVVSTLLSIANCIFEMKVIGLSVIPELHKICNGPGQITDVLQLNIGENPMTVKTGYCNDYFLPKQRHPLNKRQESIVNVCGQSTTVDCVSAGSPTSEVSSGGCIDIGSGFAELPENSTFITAPGTFTLFEGTVFVQCGVAFVNLDEVAFEYCYDDLALNVESMVANCGLGSGTSALPSIATPTAAPGNSWAIQISNLGTLP